MPRRAACLALLLGALAAPAAELHTLKGQKVIGDVVRITPKEIVLSSGGKEVVTPLAGVLRLEFPDNTRVRPEDKYADVELTDGTLLHCKDYAIKGKEVQMRLLVGPEVKVPLAAVANILNNAQDDKFRKDWTERVAKRRRQDLVAVLRDDVVTPLAGTLGQGDEAGTHIEFALAGDKKEIALSRLHGLIFQREIDPNAAPAVCKATDTHGDLVIASAVSAGSAGFGLTTPAGARIELTAAQLVRLDYSSDKVAFLSQMDPVQVDQPGSPFDQYRRDRSLDNQPLKVGGEVHPVGLALHAHTELEYDLKGEYREFRARAGIDDAVSGIDFPVVLRIEGDGKVLYRRTFTRKGEKSPVPIALNIKDVQRLRIVVASLDGYDFGRHLDLVEAKVSK
jgi:hypothetical protein